MSTEEDQTEEPDPRRWRILSVLLITIFMSLVGVSIVNVALPSIQLGLGASQSDLQWVLSGYALTFGIVLVAAGRAGDLLGRGPIYLAGVGIFTLASVAAGLALDPLGLNIARFVQGVGSGLLSPQAMGMIQQYFRGAERGKAFGFFGTVVGLSVAVGPLLGGVLIELGGAANGWRWTFLANVPVGILAIVLALRWFPRPMRNARLPATAPSAAARLPRRRRPHRRRRPLTAQRPPDGAGCGGLSVRCPVQRAGTALVHPGIWTPSAPFCSEPRCLLSCCPLLRPGLPSGHGPSCPAGLGWCSSGSDGNAATRRADAAPWSIPPFFVRPAFLMGPW